jgi:hypothetical protein
MIVTGVALGFGFQLGAALCSFIGGLMTRGSPPRTA